MKLAPVSTSIILIGEIIWPLLMIIMRMVLEAVKVEALLKCETVLKKVLVLGLHSMVTGHKTDDGCYVRFQILCIYCIWNGCGTCVSAAEKPFTKITGVEINDKLISLFIMSMTSVVRRQDSKVDTFLLGVDVVDELR